MAYVSVPKDLTKVKNKVAFNLTKRQIICFAAAAAVGLPFYFLTRNLIGNSNAVMGMVVLMVPAFLFAMYERDGMPLEKVLMNMITVKFRRPHLRLYETENLYASEYRGKVQNKQTELKPEPLYIFTYYKNSSDVKLYVAYSKELEKMNARSILPSMLYLTCDEGNMSEAQLNAHLASITATTSAIAEKGVIKELLFKRALDYYHVRDFENGIADMDSYVLKYGDDVLSLMLRAQCRYAQLEVSSSTAQATDLRLGYLMVLQDYTRALDLLPQSPYLHYNVGCMMIKLSDYQGAIAAFGKAIELDNHFPDAWFGRGVAYILNGQLSEGLNNLSQAGEYGLYSAYNLIKKYSNEKK